MRLIPILMIVWRGMRIAPLVATLLLSALIAGCAGTGAAESRTSKPHIVAAENVWGSIAAQLAGPDATVTSVINDPATDPHSYEPTVADARQVSAARLVIVNGIGYDRWATQLVAASPAPHRLTLTVGSLLHLRTGDNPHQWYDPASIERVTTAITRDLQRIDPAHAAEYAARRTTFNRQSLAGYHAEIARIRRTYAGVAVGASESIFAPLARALGLRLLTPQHFMNAVAEGTDVSAADATIAEDQLARRQIKVWVYNAQNVSPEIEHLGSLARAHGIPIATITETLTPRRASFQRWQTAQLTGLEHALHAATGR
jgi:zinc/manganese transport system substrate-binding protein